MKNSRLLEWLANNRSPILVIVLILTGGLHFAGVGYHGYLHPSHDNVPFVLQHYNPNALEADFHAQASRESNPRQPFAMFMVTIAFLFGGDVFSTFAAQQLLVSLLGGVVQFVFYRLLLKKILRAEALPLSFDVALAAAVVFMQLGDFAWGFLGPFGNLIYIAFQFFRLANFDALMVRGHAQTWSALLLMLAWISYMSKNRFTLVFLVLALISGVFHPVQTLIINTMVCCSLIWIENKRRTILAFLYAAVLPSAMVWVIFKPAPMVDAEAAAIYYLEFHRLHYMLSTFVGEEGVAAVFGRIALVGIIGTYLIYRRLAVGYMLLSCAAILAAAWLSQYYLAEHMHLQQIIYLGPSRFLSMTFWIEVFAFLAIAHVVWRTRKVPLAKQQQTTNTWLRLAMCAIVVGWGGFLWHRSTHRSFQVSQNPSAEAYLVKHVKPNEAVAWHYKLGVEPRTVRNIYLVSAFVSSDFPFYVPAIPEYAQRRAVITHLETPTAADVALLRKGKVSHAVLPDTMVADTAVWQLAYRAAPYAVYTWR